MNFMAPTFGTAARAGRRVLGGFSWREMPLAVRVLFGVLVGSLVIVVVHDGTSWLDALDPVYESVYNGILVGSAVLCLARGVLDRDERVAWTVVGVSLALWASGNIYWQLALSDVGRGAVSLRGRRLLARVPSRLLRRRPAACPKALAALGFPAVAGRHHRRADDGRDQRRGHLWGGARIHRWRHRRRGDEPGLSARRHDPAWPRDWRYGGGPWAA